MTDAPSSKLSGLVALWNSRSKGLMKHMALEIMDAGPKGVTMRMPFNREFCIDEAETLVHGGVLTTLLDSAFGLANFAAIDEVASMATLDLRVDYLRPARSRLALVVHAECYRQTRHVAFNSGRIWFEGAEDEEIARGAASFALLLRSGESLIEKFVSAESGR